VNVYPVYNLSENFSICSGDNYTFPDGTTQTNITAQVIHTSNLQSVLFCDSVIQTTVYVNPVNSISENVSICSGDNFTFPDGTTQANITAQVIHTSNLQSVLFCDSVIQTTVDVITIDTSVTQNAGVLTASTSGAAYQWLYCDSSFSEVTGETNQSFTAVVSGNYAVEITENSCVDTSYCYNVTIIGISGRLSDEGMYFFPNPTEGKITVVADQIILIEIYNDLGQIVKKSEKSGEINICNEPSGVYYIKVVTDKKAITEKIIKQ
jgi:hypothetical protein